MVSVYPLLLFGGCSLRVDLDRGQFIISVDDGWIRFKVSTAQVGVLFLTNVLHDVISNVVYVGERLSIGLLTQM